MDPNIHRYLIAVLVTIALAGVIALAAGSGARAEPQPAFDRAIVERLVRAQEAQTRALEKIASAAERCKR
jgi:hypothetical protein